MVVEHGWFALAGGEMAYSGDVSEQRSENAGDARRVFISYRRLDDEPPPERPKADGFVQYFWRQLFYELGQLGVPQTILWRDRGKIEVGDTWSAIIIDELAKADLFLAIVSRNYVTSDWCEREVTTFAEKLNVLSEHVRSRRIFRIDKQRVPPAELPEPLRAIQAIKFYMEDKETGYEQEFYWRGQVKRRSDYLAAIRSVAVSIHRRLGELGVSMETPPSSNITKTATAKISRGTVFVAKPAGDVFDHYEALVKDLQHRGYSVLPDPEKELPTDGSEVTQILTSALEKALLSIHLIGSRRGFRPEGLPDDVVPLQLSLALERSKRDASFQRLVWIPRNLLVETRDKTLEKVNRDPVQSFKEFSTHFETDQLDGDTPSRFREFVAQRLERKSGTSLARLRTVYLVCSPLDRALALEVGRRCRERSLIPVLPRSDAAPLSALAGGNPLESSTVLVCWQAAGYNEILAILMDPTLQKFSEERSRSRLRVFAPAPSTDEQKDAAHIGVGLAGPSQVVFSFEDLFSEGNLQ
jgi:hypothetical protein